MIGRMQKAIILSDLHVPYHDRVVHPKVMRMIRDDKPDIVVINGDMLDAGSLSMHPQRFGDTMETLGENYAAGNKYLDDLDSVLPKGAKKYFNYGNHEDRFFRFLSSPEFQKLQGAVKGPTEGLRLRERGYEVGEQWNESYVLLGSHLEVTHGMFTPVHAAKKHLDEFQGSVLFGHTHRLQSHVTGRRGAWNVGFLGDLAASAFHYATRPQRDKWAQSFATVHIDDNGLFWVSPIQIFQRRFVYNGKTY